MRNLKIAILGAGTAGLAAAAFLKRSGHNVTMYEKFAAPKPLGAGLMLQPTGLAVLARLGLDKKAIEQSSPIHTLDGRVVKTGRPIFDVAYKTLSPHIYGLGIHRATLFNLLYDDVIERGVSVITSTEITDITYDGETVYALSGNLPFGPYDLVIDAQGMNSKIRDRHAKVKLDKAYPYAALWGVCRDVERVFDPHALMQRYQKARHMIGVLPIGTLKGDSHPSVAFFWSLRAADYTRWCDDGMDAWKKEVIDLCPEVETLINQFNVASDLNFAKYKDVILRQWHGRNLAFIGDAAHCTSPQLGQGANIALVDAMVLDQCLGEYDTLQEVLRNYTARRRCHTSFYQRASRWLTPFFQSDSNIMPVIRDLLFGLLCKTPYIKTEMVRTLSGVKTGLFSNMNPAEWHSDYDVKKK